MDTSPDDLAIILSLLTILLCICRRLDRLDSVPLVGTPWWVRSRGSENTYNNMDFSSDSFPSLQASQAKKRSITDMNDMMANRLPVVITIGGS